MLTLFHSPQSRSTRVVALLHAMGVLDDIQIKTVTIPRSDGNGSTDTENPHPEKKVPVLKHNGELIRETSAIMIYLTDHFNSPLGRQVGKTGRGTYLSWMAYYGGVVEPVIVGNFIGIQEEPTFTATFRGLTEIQQTLEAALADGPFLMGDNITAVDFIMASPFQWAPHVTPEHPAIRNWVKRVSEHPSSVWAASLS